MRPWTISSNILFTGNMDKAEIAAALNRIGDILELLGENPFKVRAHHNAARAVETLGADIAEVAEAGELTAVKGIGKHIAEKIEAFINTGSIPELEELEAKIPPGIFEILKIPGLGPKKVKAIWDNLGVTTVGELEYACNENRLVELSGFGAKSQDKILRGIETLKKYSDRFLLPDAITQSQTVLEHVKGGKAVIRAQVAGSARRAKEVIKDVDIIASSNDPGKVMDHFVAAPGVVDVIAHGETKSTIRLESGITVDLRVVSDAQFPYALHHFTGSREHNTAMRSLAKSRGLKMNEYGLFKTDGELVKVADEEGLFEALGLAHIPPERRENIGEIEAAAKGATPPLVTADDVRGVFHCHTDYSDGTETLEKMAGACRERGYGYLGIADHSRSAHYAGGLSVDDLKRQSDHIDRVNEKMKWFRVFKGVESDILPGGELDYPDKVLDKLEFVVASVHSGFHDDADKMTERIVRAIENPHTTMLGHPTGRLLLAREGYPVDMDAIIEACARHNVIIELNANPHRLDIDWRHIGAAKRAGVKISINPDAHRIPGLDHVSYGVMIARKGGLEPEDVFNTLGTDEAAAALGRMKKGK